MVLYTTHITPRLAYMAHWLGMEIFGQPLKLLVDENALTKDTWILNYTNEPIAFESFWIKPHSLLFQTKIQQQTITLATINGFPCFFETDGDFAFDILAASFYLLQRYEEYLPHKKDEYGRFAHEQSLAFKHQFLHLPLVDLWVEALKEGIYKKNDFTKRLFKKSIFTFIPTYDVDIAYSYRGKGFTRSLFRCLRTLGREPWVKVRKDIALGNKKDPFDIYDELDKLHHVHNLKPIYFFLVPQKQKGYDKNIAPFTKEMKALVPAIASHNAIGVHPSWQSGDKEKLLWQEAETMATLSQQQITKSRQHYIRMQLPQTFRLLIKCGISQDYSMGYGSINGFRASTSKPYFWYDLEKEEHTSLQLFPFSYMEANSIFEQKHSPALALEEFTHYCNIIKRVSGTYISIFHNHLIGYDNRGRAWIEMYKAALEVCKT